MKVYKYRKYDSLHLDAIESNYFWASTRECLNDPFETLFLTDTLNSQLALLKSFLPDKKSSTREREDISNLLLEMTSDVGIFSLSTSNLSELLWAHYGDSHKGFCIEYDMDNLAYNNLYHGLHVFPIRYNNNPPELSINDFNKDPIPLLQKIAGTKSLSWEYEHEIRILTDKSGQHSYDYSAVTGVYFGNRMENNHKQSIMERLKGRGIRYYQVELASNQYNLTAIPIEDTYKNSPSYLFQVVEPTDIHYEFGEKTYNKLLKKGSVRIILSKKVSNQVLDFLSKDIKNKVFRQAERLSIFYCLDSINASDVAWATSHYDKDEFETKILGLSIEDEIKVKQILDESMRDAVGAWIDNTGYAIPATLLFRENSSYFIERIFADGSSDIKKKEITFKPDGIKLTDAILDHHGEYITINNVGLLQYHNSERVFKAIKPYRFNGLHYN